MTIRQKHLEFSDAIGGPGDNCNDWPSEIHRAESDCDAEVQDCDAEVQDCVVEVQDCVVEVQDCVVEVQDCVAEVQDCVADVQDCVAEVRDCVTEVQDCVTEVQDCDADVQDCVTEVREEPMRRRRPDRSPSVRKPGKKQVAQQCARDVKCFLARRDAEVNSPATYTRGMSDTVAGTPEEGRDGRHTIGQERTWGGSERYLTYAPQPKVLVSAPPPEGPLRIALCDAACDAALGGGLACGALHEIHGLHLDDGSARVLSCSSSASARGATFANDRWIVPFGCILHIVRKALRHPAMAGRSVAWIGSRIHPGPHLLSELLCDNADAGAPVSGSVGSSQAWLDDVLERRSLFIADMPGEPGERDSLLATHASAATRWTSMPQPSMPHLVGTPRSSRRGPSSGSGHTDALAHARLWSAELAIRLEASGVIVIDGSGFDHIAWRRLQLAASTAREIALQHVGAEGSGAYGGPLVLVVTPPDDALPKRRRHGDGAVDSEPASRRLRIAATQWSVHAEVAPDTEAAGASEASPGGSARIGSLERRIGARVDGAPSSLRLRFRWRMQLMHVRTGFNRQMDAGPDAGGLMAAANDPPVNSGTDARQFAGRGAGAVYEAIANQSLALSINMSRTAYADAAWDALRAGRPKIRHAVEDSQGFDLDMTANCISRDISRDISRGISVGAPQESWGVRSA